MGSAIEEVLGFLGKHIPGFESFHSWFNSLVDKQWVFYGVLILTVLVAIYFYFKFPREDS